MKCVAWLVILSFLSCFLHDAMLQKHHTSVISVANGGAWGTWGKIEFCKHGYAIGFHLKVKLTLSMAFLRN